MFISKNSFQGSGHVEPTSSNQKLSLESDVFWSCQLSLFSWQALTDGDGDRFGMVAAAARAAIVRSLANLATESVSNVNPSVVQLQLLETLSEAWPLRWPGGPLGALSGSTLGAPVLSTSLGQASPSEDSSLVIAERIWRRRELAAGVMQSLGCFLSAPTKLR